METKDLMQPPVKRSRREPLKNAIVSVWRQVLVEDAPVVKLGSKKSAKRLTPKLGLREVEFAVAAGR